MLFDAVPRLLITSIDDYFRAVSKSVQSIAPIPMPLATKRGTSYKSEQYKRKTTESLGNDVLIKIFYDFRNHVQPDSFSKMLKPLCLF